MIRAKVFESHKFHVTPAELNAAYGEQGRSFPSQSGAESHKRNLLKEGKKSYITPLFSYNPKDIYLDGEKVKLAECAEKQKKGYLVTVV